MIDLRSDTVTRPTQAMRNAMAVAEVGDDVYLEDPTVNRLQEKAAELFGFEASLFVPTGTMGNQICVKLHTKHGQETIVDARSHVYGLEVGMMTAFSGTLPRVIETDNGHLTWDKIEASIQPKAYYKAQTALICLENTHNMASGTVMPVVQFKKICQEAHDRQIKVHLDGARIFNAATALGVSVSELTEGADTVTFCLSKGLGAPVGSMVLGTRELIEQARVIRKMLGGGMRQAGVLAAAGLVALEEGPKGLLADHENAKMIASELANMPGVKINLDEIVTNIVIADIEKTGYTSSGFCERLAYRGVLIGAVNNYKIRLVTHHDVDRISCKTAIQAFYRVLVDID